MILNTIIALTIAITIHEFSHALIADKLGDPTPRASGRLTLNPLAHLDPIGTIMLFVAHFGWGKPVPIDPYNLKNPRRDEMLISLAGPVSNIILAMLFTLLFRLIHLDLFRFIIAINLSLAIFNLLPFYPLDGSHIFPDLFPPAMGQIILIFLILPLFNGYSLISSLISPIVNSYLRLLPFL